MKKDTTVNMTAGSPIRLLLAQAFSRGIIGLFVNEAEVIAIGATALRLTSWFYGNTAQMR